LSRSLPCRAAWFFAAFGPCTIGLCTIGHGAETNDVAVTPYRPTVSTPAELSAPGWIEAELGVIGSDGGAPPARDSAPYALKLAFSDDWGVRIDGEIWVRDIGTDGRSMSGVGDTGIILKRRFALNARSAFGLEAGVMAPTAAAGLHSGSGRTDYLATAIYSADLGPDWHADFNFMFTRLGATDSGASRDLQTWAAALSYAIEPRWGVVGELSGTHQGGADATEQLLLAATYTPKKRIAWDLGFARGLTSASPAWSLFGGCTFLVAPF
jgi:hypothetical protein